jgi:hypothetical protein
MRKCPDCAEENISESLFCKHCGHCLLAPDPEVIRWSLATHTEQQTTPEGIDFNDGHLVKKSRPVALRIRRPREPFVIGGWLLLLNFLVLTLMSYIVMMVIR